MDYIPGFMYRMRFNWNFIALRCVKFKSETKTIANRPHVLRSFDCHANNRKQQRIVFRCLQLKQTRCHIAMTLKNFDGCFVKCIYGGE